MSERLVGRRHQRGQALIYGLFVLIGGLAALFYLFNTGQLMAEKIKLVNTADAAAYSGGIMNARALNFDAYTNRAMVANTVVIAQLVSIASWVRYANTLGNCSDSQGVTCAAYADLSIPAKYPLFYPSFMMAEYEGPFAYNYLIEKTGSDGRGVLKSLEKVSDKIIHSVLMNAQRAVYAGLLPARQFVMQDVADANYHNDGQVVVDPVPLSIGADLTDFVQNYNGNDRKRFAEVATTAADRDPSAPNQQSFVKRRSWDMPALYANCASAYATGRVDWLDRRGGTELIGYDEWRALDTLSEKVWVPKNKTDVLCQGISEQPAAYGLQDAAQNPTTFDADPTHYDSSQLINPGTTALAQMMTSMSSTSWDYQGLPSFYDLSPDTLKQTDPRLLLAIRVRRSKSETRTSEGRSQIATTPLLNNYKANPAGGAELVAVSAAEVFFQRPQGSSSNVYGKGIGAPLETGSLFNPYWQVHLIQSDASVKAAQALQRAALP